MLTTYINSLPYTNFVLIEDTVQCKGDRILEYLAKNHAKNIPTYLLVLEGNFRRIQNKLTNVICHDLSTNLRNWVLKPHNDFQTILNSLHAKKCVVIINSLAHLIVFFGLAETCKILNEITRKVNIEQLITILHTDLLANKDNTVQYIRHLATLHMELGENRHISYTYKKGIRKIVKQTEKYEFENGRFITKIIKRHDKIAVTEVTDQMIPENMSTFKISLSEKDKESRSGLVLPYLPKDESSDSDGGKIYYSFDDIDDWDEEDPDDDLEI